MPEHTATPTSVYRYYDAHGLLLYVGVTSRGTVRNSEHNKDKAWWPYVTRQEVDHYPSRSEALRVEAALIKDLRPPFNTIHNPDAHVTRAAYEQLVNSPAVDANPMTLFTDLRGIFPTEAVTSTVVRTLPEHYPIARRLVLVRDLPLPIIRDAGDRQVGRVLDIKTQGPCAFVRFSKPVHGLERARLRLGFVHLKEPKPIRIRYVTCASSIDGIESSA